MPRLTPPSPRSGFIEPCLPSPADRPPSGPGWIPTPPRFRWVASRRGYASCMRHDAGPHDVPAPPLITGETDDPLTFELSCKDEMRVGQKNKLTYRWARKGSRPRAAHDQRTQSTYLFGAVCPERGAGAALVLPACNCEAMQLHLDEIATKVALERTPLSSLIRPAGMAPKPWWFRTTSHSCRCRRAELVVEPNFQIFRRYRRSLLLRLEHAHRSAVENHVHRPPRLGSRRSLNLRIGISGGLGEAKTRLSQATGDTEKFCRRRQQPSRPPLARIRPGRRSSATHG
jgi:hypothetical protein